MTRVRFDRCNRCQSRVLWVTRWPDRQRLPLDHTPVDPDSMAAATALAVAGHFAYSRTDLAELLMANRRIALEDARTAAGTDFPWHRKHACPYPTEEAS